MLRPEYTGHRFLYYASQLHRVQPAAERIVDLPLLRGRSLLVTGQFNDLVDRARTLRASHSAIDFVENDECGP